MTKSRNNQKAGRRQALTMVEILVVIAILAVLSGVLLISIRTSSSATQRQAAQQQMLQIVTAIEQYASFWPRWEEGGAIVSDKGWPDYSPWRLFRPTGAGGPYAQLINFNDAPTYAVAGLGSGIVEDPTNRQPDRVEIFPNGGDVLGANICLAYALSQPRGKGPYLQINDAGALFRPVRDVDPGVTNPNLPEHTQSNIAVRSILLVDPWGMPYRYFWYFRHPNAHRGILPIANADVSSFDIGNPVNPATFHRAVGFVLESAGPDRRYGNLWQLGTLNDNDRDLIEAQDNLIRIVP